MPAGAETTYRSSSNLLFGLLTNPDQLDALRADRDLMPQAIEEGLRWEPPLLGIMRTATRDTEVDGMPIPAGSIVSVNLGSANHDERYWDNAEEFDLFRKPRSTSRSRGARTCASGCTWPAWRRGSCSRRSSTASPTSASTPTPRRPSSPGDLPRAQLAARRLGLITAHGPTLADVNVRFP